MKWCGDQNRPLDLIAMGRVAVDFYAEQIGASLVDAQIFRKYLGGCAGNIAVGSARLGLRASMLSCVGSDDLGRFLQRTLQEEGVDTSALQISEKHLTGLVVLGVNPPDRFPLIFYRNDCADMAIDKRNITEDYMRKAQALVVTGTGLSHAKTRDVTLHAIACARSAGTKVILDVDYRPVLWGLLPPGDGENRYVASRTASYAIASILPLVDLVVGTEEECKLAGSHDDIHHAVKNIIAQTNAFVVVKRGVDGASCFAAQHEPLHEKAFPVDIVNVLGAGDAFMSGLLSQLLRGHEMRDALRHANAAGALVVARHGCSHSCPSQSEVAYFIKHYSDEKTVFAKPLERLHNRVLLKDAARVRPMPIFAFCHRWQLEEICTQHNVTFDRISEFKTALAEALALASTTNAIKNPWMLCDPHYGHGALKVAQSAGINAIVALERSGTPLLEWLVDESAFEILYARPPSWGVKVLAHVHDGLFDSAMAHQLSRLQECARACSKLDRKLMLEVIIPDDKDDDVLLASVQRIYRAGVYPYWWKLRRFSSVENFLRLSRIIDEYDDAARVVILGGNAKHLDDYRHDFMCAQASHHGIGFAVGRSIFWQSFCDFIEGKRNLVDVKADVTTRFTTLYDLWTNKENA